MSDNTDNVRELYRDLESELSSMGPRSFVSQVDIVTTNNGHNIAYSALYKGQGAIFVIGWDTMAFFGWALTLGFLFLLPSHCGLAQFCAAVIMWMFVIERIMEVWHGLEHEFRHEHEHVVEQRQELVQEERQAPVERQVEEILEEHDPFEVLEAPWFNVIEIAD